MCRRNQLYGCAVLTFGLGLLIGLWIHGGFLAHVFGFGAVILGIYLCQKK